MDVLVAPQEIHVLASASRFEALLDFEGVVFQQGKAVQAPRNA